jgi:hypothetical protein
MSSEKTAEFFKDKSEEEIINWMLRNMTPEQNRACFEGDIPEMPDVSDPKVDDKDELMKIRETCAKKKYVIHKIDGDMVNFWYFTGNTWKYYTRPLIEFQNGEECGDDTLVTDGIRDELVEKYNDPDDVEQMDEFNRTREIYSRENINTDWVKGEAPGKPVNNLLTAIEIQKKVHVPVKYKMIFDFTPVLIVNATDEKVFYYYLINGSGNLRFVRTSINIDKFEGDLNEINEDIELQVLEGGGGGSAAMTGDEWKAAIKRAASEIDEDDIEIIKEIYSNAPLSERQHYFMKDLFGDSKFGSAYRNGIDLNSVDLSQYVMNKFGTNTARLFNAQIVSNSFGTKTIMLVPK